MDRDGDRTAIECSVGLLSMAINFYNKYGQVETIAQEIRAFAPKIRRY